MRKLREKNEPLLRGGEIISLLDLLGGKATCDECGRWENLPTLSEAELPKMAADRGWSKDADGKDLCPLCTKAAAK